jgi:hypothetical protein
MSNGLATWVGVNAPVASLVGFDCSVHMSKTIPLLIYSVC